VTDKLDLLYEAAVCARDAELANDRIDRLDLLVQEYGIIVVAKRGHGMRTAQSVRSVAWDAFKSADGNTIPTLIGEVVHEMNNPPAPTTYFNNAHRPASEAHKEGRE
jgi:hypothetical protein